VYSRKTEILGTLPFFWDKKLVFLSVPVAIYHRMLKFGTTGSGTFESRVRKLRLQYRYRTLWNVESGFKTSSFWSIITRTYFFLLFTENRVYKFSTKITHLAVLKYGYTTNRYGTRTVYNLLPVQGVGELTHGDQRLTANRSSFRINLQNINQIHLYIELVSIGTMCVLIWKNQLKPK
jgi:hypothetical protein